MLLLEPVLETVRDYLRDNLSGVTVGVSNSSNQLTKSIRITDNQKVPAYAGEEFLNLYNAISVNEYDPLATERKEVYSLTIGITRRLVGIPTDTSAEAIYTQDETLLNRTKSTMIKRAYEIITLIDGNWGIPALVNQLDLGDFCILGPLGFLSSSPLEEKFAEHFHLEDDSERPQALFLELNFGGMPVYTDKYEG